MHLLSLRPDDSLTILRTALSIPLHALRFPPACDPSYRALTFTLTGLLPAEHTSLLWTYHAIAITPAGPMELVRSSLSTISGLPCVTVRSAPAITVSRACSAFTHVMACMLAESLNDPFIESSDSFVASAAVSIATGWSEPVPGRELHPLKSSAFHGALFRQLLVWFEIETGLWLRYTETFTSSAAADRL